ncbi:MAG: cupin domain-containing protein [Myxococcales bacterium]|nr:cupin domain-containing protein [Myxococcales bacterium]
MKVVDYRNLKAFSGEKMKKVSLFDTERMFADVYCFRPGQAQKPHAHAGSDKVYFVLEGKGTFRVGAEEKILGPGEATIAPSGEDHGVVNTSDADLVVLVFMAPKP